MKKTAVVLSLSLLPLSFAQAAITRPGPPLHLDLDMTSSEYASYLKAQTKHRKSMVKEDDPAIAEALLVGKRLSDWLATENARRGAGTQLRLTSPLTRPSNSIEKPKSYNAATVAASLEQHRQELPADMWAVLEGAPFPDTLPLPDADFILLARKVDKTYQTAARFKSLIPYIDSYRAQKAWDVRSFYFFKSNAWTEERIGGFSGLPLDEQTAVLTNLVGMCLNTRAPLTECQQLVAQAVTNEDLPNLFGQLYAYSSEVWDSFFNIPDEVARTDIQYTDSTSMIVPFRTPELPRFMPYLQDNIQAEWKWGDWQLHLEFNETALAHLVFKTGEVPHVDSLGGNTITMDDVQPIEEYESQWTIRHEFGHVLGFPDCYHEFYDDDLQAFVSYQLDVTDLMCSRAGDMKERLYTELTRVYFKPIQE